MAHQLSYVPAGTSKQLVAQQLSSVTGYIYFEVMSEVGHEDCTEFRIYENKMNEANKTQLRGALKADYLDKRQGVLSIMRAMFIRAE